MILGGGSGKANRAPGFDSFFALPHTSVVECCAHLQSYFSKVLVMRKAFFSLGQNAPAGRQHLAAADMGMNTMP